MTVSTFGGGNLGATGPTFGGGDWGVSEPTAPGRPFTEDIIFKPFDSGNWWDTPLNWTSNFWYNNVSRPLGYDNKPNIANADGSINWGSFWNDIARTNMEMLQPTNWPTLAGLSANSVINTYDSGIRAVNTYVGGTASLGWGLTSAAAGGFDWSKSSNALLRDGNLSLDDLDQIFNPFENDVTLGQQIINGMVGVTSNAVDTGLNLVSGDARWGDQNRANVEALAAANSAERLTDPSNQRQLGSIWNIYNQDFDVWNEEQRETAFEQMGPWQLSSGFLDAAWQFYAAPEVLGAKALGIGAKSARFYDVTQQGARANMAREMMDFNIYKMTDGQYGARTKWGLMSERLAGMDAAAIRKSGIARLSNDPERVSFVLGRTNDPKSTQDALLALAGDRNAAARVAMKSPLAGDALLNSYRAEDDLRSVLEDAADMWDYTGAKPPKTEDVLGMLRGDRDAAKRVAKSTPNLDDAPETLKAATVLARRRAAAERVLGPESEVKYLQGVIDEWSSFNGGAVTLREVPKNLGNLARAERKAARASGEKWAVTSFSMTPMGRAIRFIQSSGAKPATTRATGMFRLTDDAEFAAELDSTLTTTKWLRRKGAQTGQDGNRLITITKIGEDGQPYKTRVEVSEYRRMKMNEGLALRGSDTQSLATARLNFVQQLEQDLVMGMLEDYGVDIREAMDLLENYKHMRNQVKQQLLERGWVRDLDGSVNVAGVELQSELAETAQFVNLDFIEMVLRSSDYGVARRAGQATRERSIALVGLFDQVWRPLALMRLGYTQRNLAESSLRSLAAFGSVGEMGWKAEGFNNFMANTGWRLASTRNRVRNWRTPSARRLRTKIRGAQAQAASNRQRAASARRDLRVTDDQIEKMKARERALVMERRLEEMESEWALGESATWDNVAENASARVGEAVLDYADVVYVPAREAKPFGTRKTGVGSLNEQGAIDLSDAPPDTTGFVLGERAPVSYESADDLGSFLRNPVEGKRFDELTAKGDLTQEELTEWQRLLVKDRTLAARDHATRGDWLATINGDGTYTRVRNHDTVIEAAVRDMRPADLVERDGIAGLVIVPKGTRPLAVRSTVYGRTLDLRFNNSEYDDLFEVIGGVRKGDLTGPQGGQTKAARAVQQAYKALMADPSYAGTDDAWKQVKELRDVLRYAEEDPEIMEALRRRLWAASLPTPVRRALYNRGVLIPSRELSRRIGNIRGGLKTAKAEAKFNLLEEVDALRLQVDEMLDGLPEGEFVWHSTGRRIAGDVVDEEVNLSKANLENYRGPGFYMTDNGVIGGEYLAGRAGTAEFRYGGKSILDSAKSNTEPIMYVSDAPPSKADFFDYDAPWRDGNLDPDDFAGQELRAWQENFANDFIAEAAEREGVQVELNMDALDDEVFNFSMTQQAFRGVEVPEYPNQYDFIEMLVVRGMDAGMDQASAWDLVIQGLRAQGYKGGRHIGGRANYLPNTPDHQVYIMWEPPALTPLEELSEQAIITRDALRRLNKLTADAEDALRAQEIAAGVSADKYNSRIFLQHKGFAQQNILNEVGLDNLSAAASDAGYGKVLVNDSDVPGQEAVVFLNDMLDVNGGLDNAIDNAVPSYIDDAYLGSGNTADWTVAPADGGKLLLREERRLRQLAQREGTPDAKRFSVEERNWMINTMEENNLTHIAINTKNGKVWITKSDLAPSKSASSKYIEATEGDLLDAEVAQTLARNNDYSILMGRRSTAEQRLYEADAAARQNEAQLKELTNTYEALRSARKKKVRSGRGTTTYKGQTWDDAFAENQQGNKWLAAASSDATTARDTIGYTNDMTATLRRTAEKADLKPYQKLYWDELTIYLNQMIRNDPVAMRVLAGESDDQIVAWMRSKDPLARATVRDTAMSRDKDDLIASINNRRELISKYVPDDGLKAKLTEGDVTSDDVLVTLGWRNMPSLEGMVAAETNSMLSRFTTRVMKTLGTLPEDTVIRHPFYRARFNDEMRRQVDLFDGSEISDANLKAFRREAHKYALKTTRETLYTVTRLSTPAYALRFVLPFFPAWESSMKFWAKQAVRKPETVVRYSQIIGAEGSGGLVLDEEMMPLEGDGRSLRDLPQHLFSPGGGWLVIPMPLTGGSNFGAPAMQSLMIPKESMNVILPGKYPWLPTADPIVQIPLSMLVKQQPTKAAMVAEMELFGLPVGDILMEQALPFGRPYEETEILAMIGEAVAPPAAKRFVDIMRGESAPDVLATADSLYRDNMTRWELSGREGPKPSWDEAVGDAKRYMMFRVGVGLTSPAAVRTGGPFDFYIAEARRIDRKYAGDPDAMEKSDNEFLSLYGETFFRYTKSISGSRGSGISPTISAQGAYEANKDEAAKLARIGDSGRVLQVLTYPFGLDEDFNDVIYRSQLNTGIDGVQGRYLRGGPGESQTILTGSASEDATQRSLGWIKYRQMEDALQAEATRAGLKNYQQDQALVQQRAAYVQQLEFSYPAWAEDRATYDTKGYQDTIWGMEILLSGPNYMKNYGNLPMVGYMQEYMDYRQFMVDTLAVRKAQGGSDRLTASSNQDIAEYAEEVKLYFSSTDVDPQWLAFYTRFLERDPLLPVAPLPEELRWR